MVPRWNGAMREAIPTSPIHVEYTTHMHGVDVADQLRTWYTTHNRSHKWWHYMFFFLLDMKVVTMFIMYVAACKTFFMHPRKPRHTYTFMTELCGALLRNWEGRGTSIAYLSAQGTSICFPVQTILWNPFVVCNIETLPLIRPYTYCAKCKKYMCLKKGCFEWYHKNLHRIAMKR